MTLALSATSSTISSEPLSYSFTKKINMILGSTHFIYIFGAKCGPQFT